MFSPQSSVQNSIELIPAATLLKLLFVPQDVKTGQTSGARYANIELRVIEGPYEGRVLFDMISDPFDPKASEGGKKMGILALTRLCEAVGIFDIAKPESYNRYSDPATTIYTVLGDLESQTVAARVKIEKGKDGHADKNRVSEYLTPNPNSGTGNKGWADLMTGNPGANPPQRAAAFGGAAQTQPQAGQPGWLKGPNA